MSDVTPPPVPTPAPAPAPEPTPYAATPYPTTPYSSASVGPKTNTLAIISLVLAFFISLGAIICGHIALNQIKQTGEGGRGLAIAGLVLGYIGLIGGLIFAVVALVFPFFVLSTQGFAP